MRIYIKDTDGPLKDNFDETRARFEDLFRDEEISFSAADIFPGASLTALLAEYKEALYVGIPVAIFFAGKRIEENLEAWGKILGRLVSLFQRIKSAFSRNRVTVDNHSAALIAFHHVVESYDSEGFRLMRVLGINGLGQEVIDCMTEQTDELFVGTFMSFLCIFELDELRYYEVVVDSSGDVLRSALLTREQDGGVHTPEDF